MEHTEKFFSTYEVELQKLNKDNESIDSNVYYNNDAIECPSYQEAMDLASEYEKDFRVKNYYDVIVINKLIYDENYDFEDFEEIKKIKLKKPNLGETPRMKLLELLKVIMHTHKYKVFVQDTDDYFCEYSHVEKEEVNPNEIEKFLDCEVLGVDRDWNITILIKK